MRVSRAGSRTGTWLVCVSVVTYIVDSCENENMTSLDCFGYSKETVEELKEKLPCRKSQLHMLLRLFARRTSLACPCVFVYGHTATAKSLVVETLLIDLQVGVCICCV